MLARDPVRATAAWTPHAAAHTRRPVSDPTMHEPPGEPLVDFHRRLDELGPRHPRVVGRHLMTLGAVVLAAALTVRLSIMHVSFAVLLAGALLARPPVHRLPGWWVAACFAAWQALSVAASPYDDPMKGWGMAYTWLALYLVAAVAVRPGPRRALLAALAAGVVAVALLVALQAAVGYDSTAKPWRIDPAAPALGHASGLHSQHLTMGFLAAAAAIVLAVGGRGMPGWLRWSATAAALVALGLTRCRSAVLGLAAAAFAANAAHGWRRLALGAALALAVGGAALVTLRAVDPHRFAAMLEGRDGRWVIWRTSVDLIGDHPLTGTGGARAFQRQFRERYPEVVPDVPAEFPGGAPHAHNSLLSIAAEHGLPAAALYLAWFAAIARWLWRRRHRDPRALDLGLAAITLALGAGAFEHYAGDSEASYAVMVALGLALALDAAPRSVRSHGRGEGGQHAPSPRTTTLAVRARM